MPPFPGFGVSGYRTLSGDPQWIPLDPAVTVFLGGNNSGKSNVLRLLHEHMGGIFASLRNGQTPQTFDPRHDVPLGLDDRRLRVLWPIDVEGIQGDPRYDGVRQDMERLLMRPELNELALTSLPYASEALPENLGIDITFAREFTEASRAEIDWPRMSMTLTGNAGGTEGEDARRSLHHLREWCFPPPDAVFVPPRRALQADGVSSDSWNFSGEGMIHQLARLKSPQFDERVNRERAASLTHDLRVLLEDGRVDFDVPYDRSTVNVLLGGEWFPLELLGTGTEHAVMILAARHVFPDKLLCLEEPDAHLHPRLQRRLLALLREGRGRQVAIATHSAHMIDEADTVVAIRLEGLRSSVTQVGNHALFEALRALGYRASDLLQTNSIIWVEGPSDRVFLLHWLKVVAPELIEGVDFSIVFYGGALLARLSAEIDATDDPTLVDLWRINRRMWLIMDSDQGEGELKPAVQRLRDEIDRADAGGTWITDGYTVENYVDPGLLEGVVRRVHPTVERITEKSSGVDPLKHLVKADGKAFSTPDKVAIALAVAESPADLEVLDLRNKITELAEFIRANARESVVLPLAPELAQLEEPAG